MFRRFYRIILHVEDNDFGVFEDMIDDMKTSSSPKN